MKNDPTIDKEQIEFARDLVKQLEVGNRENADKLIGMLAGYYESSMFHKMGKLTRELHTSLNSFEIDSQVINLSENDLPNAKDRLNYVIQLTEQAANKTLTAVEETIPICEELGRKANGINDEWKRFMSRNHSAEEFRSLVQEIGIYLEYIVSESLKVKANLNDVLIAQDFQDLSGQSIRRVISVVHEIEQLLINFIKITGHKIGSEAPMPRQENQILSGPRIPGKESIDVMKDQDDVDDLLSSLGF